MESATSHINRRLVPVEVRDRGSCPSSSGCPSDSRLLINIFPEVQNTGALTLQPELIKCETCLVVGKDYYFIDGGLLELLLALLLFKLT